MYEQPLTGQAEGKNMSTRFGKFSAENPNKKDWKKEAEIDPESKEVKEERKPAESNTRAVDKPPLEDPQYLQQERNSNGYKYDEEPNDAKIGNPAENKDNEDDSEDHNANFKKAVMADFFNDQQNKSGSNLL